MHRTPGPHPCPLLSQNLALSSPPSPRTHTPTQQPHCPFSRQLQLCKAFFPPTLGGKKPLLRFTSLFPLAVGPGVSVFFSRPAEGRGGPVPLPALPRQRPALFLDRALRVTAASVERPESGGGVVEFGCGFFSLSRNTMEPQILKRNNPSPPPLPPFFCDKRYYHKKRGLLNYSQPPPPPPFEFF